jgi:NAD(P)-dependent dehydrogenase (short-subunit alcohol dehydrogenase family)
MGRFQGKSVLITGGSSGIGLATAKLFKAEGARIAVTGRSQQALDEARRELGEQALVLQSDTAKLGDTKVLMQKVQAAFGGLDLLFVNAGVAKFMPAEMVSEEGFDETMNINLKGAFFTVQQALPLLRSGGSVVLNTSVVDRKGMPNTSVYAASKAGLRSLARTFAAELTDKGIRVNAIAPGPIETPIYDKLGLNHEQKSGFVQQINTMNPMKRFGHADEIAKAVLYLAADATYTTGAELTVDGGMTQL